MSKPELKADVPNFGDPAAAVPFVEPCIGGPEHNFHRLCVEAIADAGLALARKGGLREAARIWHLLEAERFSRQVHQLRSELRKRAPELLRQGDGVSTTPAHAP